MGACMLRCFSCVQLCVTPWTAAHQGPLSTGFSRQEYHFLLQGNHVEPPNRPWSEWKSLSCALLFVTPWTVYPGKNTEVGSLSLLQEIFPTQGSNWGLPHCRWSLYQLSHKGSPRILEWVAYPFSSRSFQSRNWTRVSCIAGRLLTNWAIRGPCSFPS